MVGKNVTKLISLYIKVFRDGEEKLLLERMESKRIIITWLNAKCVVKCKIYDLMAYL